MLHAGLDLSRKKLDVCLLSDQGEHLDQLAVPPEVDSLRLYELALEKRITVGPGYMFSTSNAYGNFIRLNYSYAWSSLIEKALITLGKLSATLMREARRRPVAGVAVQIRAAETD